MPVYEQCWGLYGMLEFKLCCEIFLLLNMADMGYYTVLYCTILYCTTLYYTILYYTILYYTILYCTVLHHNIVRLMVVAMVILCITSVMIYHRGTSLSEQNTDLLICRCTKQDLSRTSTHSRYHKSQQPGQLLLVCLHTRMNYTKVMHKLNF